MKGKEQKKKLPFNLDISGDPAEKERSVYFLDARIQQKI